MFAMLAIWGCANGEAVAAEAEPPDSQLRIIRAYLREVNLIFRETQIVVFAGLIYWVTAESAQDRSHGREREVAQKIRR